MQFLLCKYKQVTNLFFFYYSFRFGFVTFEDVKTAERMLEKYDGADLDGFNITLRFADERRGAGGGGGGRSSDWGRGRDRGL